MELPGSNLPNRFNNIHEEYFIVKVDPDCIKQLPFERRIQLQNLGGIIWVHKTQIHFPSSYIQKNGDKEENKITMRDIPYIVDLNKKNYIGVEVDLVGEGDERDFAYATVYAYNPNSYGPAITGDNYDIPFWDSKRNNERYVYLEFDDKEKEYFKFPYQLVIGSLSKEWTHYQYPYHPRIGDKISDKNGIKGTVIKVDNKKQHVDFITKKEPHKIINNKINNLEIISRKPELKKGEKIYLINEKKEAILSDVIFGGLPPGIFYNSSIGNWGKVSFSENKIELWIEEENIIQIQNFDQKETIAPLIYNRDISDFSDGVDLWEPFQNSPKKEKKQTGNIVGRVSIINNICNIYGIDPNNKEQPLKKFSSFELDSIQQKYIVGPLVKLIPIKTNSKISLLPVENVSNSISMEIIPTIEELQSFLEETIPITKNKYHDMIIKNIKVEDLYQKKDLSFLEDKSFFGNSVLVTNHKYTDQIGYVIHNDTTNKKYTIILELPDSNKKVVVNEKEVTFLPVSPIIKKSPTKHKRFLVGDAVMIDHSEKNGGKKFLAEISEKDFYWGTGGEWEGIRIKNIFPEFEDDEYISMGNIIVEPGKATLLTDKQKQLYLIKKKKYLKNTYQDQFKINDKVYLGHKIIDIDEYGNESIQMIDSKTRLWSIYNIHGNQVVLKTDDMEGIDFNWKYAELKDLHSSLSPPYHPVSPDYSPNSPDYSPNSPDYSPDSPDYSPDSPDYNPNIPHFNPGTQYGEIIDGKMVVKSYQLPYGTDTFFQDSNQFGWDGNEILEKKIKKMVLTDQVNIIEGNHKGKTGTIKKLGEIDDSVVIIPDKKFRKTVDEEIKVTREQVEPYKIVSEFDFWKEVLQSNSGVRIIDCENKFFNAKYLFRKECCDPKKIIKVKKYKEYFSSLQIYDLVDLNDIDIGPDFYSDRGSFLEREFDTGTNICTYYLSSLSKDKQTKNYFYKSKTNYNSSAHRPDLYTEWYGNNGKPINKNASYHSLTKSDMKVIFAKNTINATAYCINCKKEGHLFTECSDPPGEHMGKCKICGESGHWLKDCPQYKGRKNKKEKEEIIFVRNMKTVKQKRNFGFSDSGEESESQGSSESKKKKKYSNK